MWLPHFGEGIHWPKPYTYTLYRTGNVYKAKPGETGLSWIREASMDVLLNACEGAVDHGLFNVKRGFHEIAAPVYIEKPILIVGEGPGATVFRVTTDNLIAFFFRNTSRAGLLHCGMDGDSKAKRMIALDNLQHSLFHNLHILNVDYDATSRAINLFGGGTGGEHCTFNLFKKIWITDCWEGVWITKTDATSWCNQNYFENVYCGSITQNAFYFDDGGAEYDNLVGNKLHFCGAQGCNIGFRIAGIQNVIEQCYAENCVAQECQDEGDRNEWRGFDTETVNLHARSIRAIINGAGDNGANDPAAAGDWNAFGRQGLWVHWTDGGDRISIYWNGAWRDLTLA